MAEESLEEREFQGRLRRYNQLNILVNANIKPFKTSVLYFLWPFLLLVFAFCLPSSAFCSLLLVFVLVLVFVFEHLGVLLLVLVLPVPSSSDPA